MYDLDKMNKKKGSITKGIYVAIAGYLFGKLVEKIVKLVIDKLSEKIYVVSSFGASDNGINLYPGDNFKVLKIDGGMAYIEIIGEIQCQYCVPEEFLYDISNYEG